MGINESKCMLLCVLADLESGQVLTIRVRLEVKAQITAHRLKLQLKRPRYELAQTKSPTREMTGEEISGPPGQKIARLFAFVGAGVIFSVAANKWRDWEKKSIEQKNQILSTNSQSVDAQEALK